MGLLVNATEAGALCGVSDATIRRAIEAGRLKAYEASGPRRTRPTDKDHSARIGPSAWRIDVDDLPGAGLPIVKVDLLLDLEARRASPAQVKELLIERAQLRATIERLNERIRSLTHHEGRDPIARPQAAPLRPDIVIAAEPVTRSHPSSWRERFTEPKFIVESVPGGHPANLPPGSMQLSDFGDLHKVSRGTIYWQKDQKHFPTTIIPQGSHNQHWLTPEQQRATLAYWNRSTRRYKMTYIPCPDCPHEEVTATMTQNEA